MKELSIEQKAKSYDEAFERVKELLSRCRTNRDRRTMVYRVEDIESIFPELAMSEDERIRKEFCKDIWTFIPNEKAHKYIAWLEKQGDKDSQVKLPTFTFDDILALQCCMETVKKVQNDKDLYEKLNDLHGRIYDAYYLEKQGEQNPYSGVSFKYNGHAWGMCARDGGVEILMDGNLKAFISLDKSFIYPISSQSALEAVKEEKIDNQTCVKPADKFKPKFKVGDWICNDVCDVHIASIENGMYYFDEGDGLSIVFVDERYHLWTIEDAMDGDVLTYKNDNVEWILIYKNIMSETCDVPHDVLKYHALFTGTVFYDSGSAGMISENYALCFTPSTKEQRELLFQKIKEAGYIFDFKNKELKEIETEIEIPFGAKDSELQEATYYIPKGFHAEIDDDKVVIKKGEKPTAWSEKDEKMFEYALNMIEWYSGKNEDKSRFVSDWLKCIKQRIGG